jgi:outer membrane protein OmpA-like peptidoglycan-associated protein
MPVDLTVETVPFVPLLIFRKGETAITPEMKQTLMGLKDIATKSVALNVSVEAYTGTYDDRKKLSDLSDQRVRSIVDALVADCGIPRDAIHTTVTKSRRIEAPAVKISVSTNRGQL